jgi:hypothetical protein
MVSVNVEGIVKDGTDDRGNTIDEVYSKASGVFAIYRATNEVCIQFADDAATGSEQRKAVVPLRPAKGQIDGLLRKLCSSVSMPDAKDVEEIRFYNRQVADAFFMAFQGEVPSATSRLDAIRADILERLYSRGRKKFALSTLIASGIGLFGLAALVLIIALIESLVRNSPMLATCTIAFVVETQLWAAALFGIMGAWFSIATALRFNEQLPTTNRLDNFVIPSLRVAIAVIAAIVLFSIVRLDLVSVSFGGHDVSWKAPPTGDKWYNLHVAIIVAFIAGFSERLVGNLIASATAVAKPAAAPPAPAGPKTSETNPRGLAGSGGAKGGSGEGTGEVADAAALADEQIDACLCDHPVEDDAEVTDDAALPPSEGGVATAATTSEKGA